MSTLPITNQPDWVHPLRRSPDPPSNGIFLYSYSFLHHGFASNRQTLFAIFQRTTEAAVEEVD